MVRQMVVLKEQKTSQFLKEVVERIVETAGPSRVILFGSHARRDASARSDVDLLVVVKDTKSRRAFVYRPISSSPRKATYGKTAAYEARY
jgi:predicted nucleotidyltransferase